ncbi:MAG: NAD(P)-dependent glycerol-1-phosphate dehydrogenase [bacterium]|nr:NAD(P)-dependent glycerol-1-phosphate dehydrogenase [bacterium]
MNFHYMELPRAVLVGTNALEKLGEFIEKVCEAKKILIVTDKKLKEIYGKKVEEVIKRNTALFWEIVLNADFENVRKVELKIKEEKVELIIGMGGGTCIDVAKLSAYESKTPFISVPTNAAHDGIASPFASIKDSGRPYSIISSSPLGVLADIEIISSAPIRYFRSGCGDLIAKITAVKDWQLARDDRGEYYGEYAASLALLSAEVIIKNSEKIKISPKEKIRDVVEALISAGVAAGIAGSSRPCSGSEHLFSHALDIIAPGKGLHGEKCGIGTILMAKLHNLDYEDLKSALENIGAPTRIKEIGISREEAIRALLLAPKLRERYTILHKINLSRDRAEKLIVETGID